MNVRIIQPSRLLMCSLLLSVISGCVAVPVRPATHDRTFNFNQDTFAYVNELDWQYKIDPLTGKTTYTQNHPAPEFSHRCFAVSRMARQFFEYAQFDPTRPKVEDVAYRRLIDAVIDRSPSEGRRLGKVQIPGYANLRSFSHAKSDLLKSASGGAWRSYVQFSNWRMIFPFSRDNQNATAQQLLNEVNQHELPIVHLIMFDPFPIATIDHVIVIYAATSDAKEIRFTAYDPNNAEEPVVLSFDRASRTFIYPTTKYFADGPINVYEIYGDELN